MSKSIRTLTGRVVGFEGVFYKVVCPDAPSHLQTLYLTAAQVRSAKVGDRVELSYRTSPSSGLWVVSHVVS